MAATHGVNITVRGGITPGVGTLTFSGTTANGELVTIGGRVYEFCTDGDVTNGRVEVDISGGNSASQSVTALVAAITGDTFAVVTAVDGALDTVVVTSKVLGTSANSIGTTKTCANAAWGGATLGGGTVGVIALQRDAELRAQRELVDISTKLSPGKWREYLSGWKGTEITCGGLYSSGDAGQRALEAAIRDKRPLDLIFSLNSGGTKYYSGRGIPTSVATSAPFDGAIGLEHKFVLTGALSIT
jgi:predicted secreted protein